MRKLLLFLVILMVLPIVSAATCGNNIVESGEQCEQYRFRGYSCGTICYMDASSPHEYDPTDRHDYEDFSCYLVGSLTCDSNCHITTGSCSDNVCGDSMLYGLEECDDGTQNSDTVPDACRTDCVLPKCGDGVVDSGEDCDDGEHNSDAIPDACRTDCTYAHCGDGVIDVSEGEECDDDFGECFHCQRCIEPYDDLSIQEDTKLCPGSYQLDDQGSEGVIIVSGSGLTVDCTGMSLYGVPRKFDIVVQDIHPAALQNIGGQATSLPGEQTPGVQQAPVVEEENTGFFASIANFFVNIFTVEEDEPEPPTLPDGISVNKVGTGIRVTGDENVLVGCDVHNYRYGIKVEGERNVLARNTACQNTHDISGTSLESIGLNDWCHSGDWNDVGFEHCTYDCSGDSGVPVEPDECQPTPCPPPGTPPENETPEVIPVDIECPDGSTAETLADCPEEEPELFECDDGTFVERERDCPVDEGCGRDMLMCDDGSCVEEKWECDPFECWDHSLVEDEDDCPSQCHSSEFECDDGDCVDEEWMCSPYVCDDGTWAPSRSDCPDEGCTLDEPILCDDEETCVDDEDDCPDDCPFECPDGSCVDSMDECGPCPGEYECANGECAASEDECIVCCKTIGGTVKPIIYYNFMQAGECGGEIVDDSFCG